MVISVALKLNPCQPTVLHSPDHRQVDQLIEPITGINEHGPSIIILLNHPPWVYNENKGYLVPLLFLLLCLRLNLHRVFRLLFLWICVSSCLPVLNPSL